MKRKNVGAIGLRGGHRENFYFCLLEYFVEKDRWFLSGLHPVRDMAGETSEEGGESHADNENILRWMTEYQLTDLVVDFPLTPPLCETCLPDCQGAGLCLRPEVRAIREKIHHLLEGEKKLIQQDPKKYERERNEQDLISAKERQGNHLKKVREDQDIHILSRSFKRRLKKGFLPYWNRPVDFWVWSEYYDQMLKFLNIAYDSYGSTSLMLMFRFNHLRRHFPPFLQVYETPVPLILLELFRSGIITSRILQNLKSIDTCAQDRLRLIHQVEKQLKVFIYEHDVDVLVKNPRAFHSFLLALAGQKILLKEVRQLPSWSLAEESHFVVPRFK